MHAVKLNIEDNVFQKFMGLLDILPKDSIQIKEIDNTPYYPAISFEEAQLKVKNSIDNINISNTQAKEIETFFNELI